jgi:hypothetical protein
MLTHWNKLFNTDCVVVDIGPHTIYPIFRVGLNSLMSACDKKYINSEITECKHIDVMIRDPDERFVSGVNEYCAQRTLDVRETWKMINKGRVYDRHFAPQFIWLMHLYRFYKGDITIRPFDYISKITSAHLNHSLSKVNVPVCEPYVKVDRCLIKYYNQTVSLQEVITRYRNVLS